MKKFLMIGLGLLVGAVAVVVGLAAAQSGQYHVERSLTISAPAAKVYALISDFHNFGKWSPWEHLDPKLEKTYSGAERGQGAVYDWSGNDQVGSGRMTIVAATENQRLDIKLEFFKPFPAISQTAWILEEEGGKTTMTWSIDGRNEGLMPKLFSLVMNMDKMLGTDFERGLSQLKNICEKPQT